MTPQEIEAQLKAMGMTMADAEQKAKEMGIDLKTFLQLQQQRAGKEQPGPQNGNTMVADSLRHAKPESLAVKPAQKKVRPKGPGGLPYFGYDIFGDVPAGIRADSRRAGGP